MSDSSNVVLIDSYRPHFSVQDPVTRSIHVLPVDLVADIVYGRRSLLECDSFEAMNRALLHHLLECVAND